MSMTCPTANTPRFVPKHRRGRQVEPGLRPEMWLPGSPEFRRQPVTRWSPTENETSVTARTAARQHIT
ncbi:MAG TPA: hypothetical protein DDX19_22150 [Rhodopirellula baltica]|nr:hypothetical protein [Rhodopirellula baltica]